MRRVLTMLGVVLLVVAGLGLTLRLALGQSPGPQLRVVESQSMGENLRVIHAPAEPDSPDSPSISFIQTLTPFCYQPDTAQDVCYVNFQQHYVDSAPATYMLFMTVTIDSRIRSVYRGFFQNTMYASYDMHTPGYKVACGEPNASDIPTMGKRYEYTIRAQDSNNATASNFGSLYCPPYIP